MKNQTPQPSIQNPICWLKVSTKNGSFSPKMKVFATSNGSVISTINASWHPLHFISGSKRGNHCYLDARVEEPPKMLKIGNFPPKRHRKGQVPESSIRDLSRTLTNFKTLEHILLSFGCGAEQVDKKIPC